MLQGKVFDDHGHPMQVLHTKKGAKRYRYYASVALNPDRHQEPGSLPRVAVGVLDGFAMEQITPLLSRGWQSEDRPQDRVSAALIRMDVGEDRVILKLKAEAVVASSNQYGAELRPLDDNVELAIAIRLKHRKGSVLIETPRTSGAPRQLDKPLVRAVCLTRIWADSLARGEAKTVTEIADRFGYWDHYVANLMPLAWLAPDLTEAILDGRQPPGVTLGALIKRQLPLDWALQRDMFAALR